MITLYGKSHCPYTEKVIDKLDDLRLSYTKLNIADSNVAEELIAKGGKRQVPYLVDGDTALYESDVIAEYLEGKYGAAAKVAHSVTVHRGGGLCSVCSAAAQKA